MAMMAANIEISQEREAREEVREKLAGRGAGSAALKKLRKQEEAQKVFLQQNKGR